jgi:hypothetical protein
MQHSTHPEENYLISYLSLRKLIGILGMTLPLILAVGGKLIFNLDIEPSISDYYHTGMRDVLVGSLWAVGAFLVIYKGYELVDNLLAKFAGLCAIGISLFPTPAGEENFLSMDWVGWMHHIFAVCFFLSLVIFSLALFTRTKQGVPPTEMKLVRNQVYIICGLIMLTCLLLMALYKILPEPNQQPIAPFKPIFWLETAAILSFAISWFVKGEGILRDK